MLLHNVPNFALVAKEATRFIYTITFYCFCFPFYYYVYIMHVDSLFNICHTAITYFHIIFFRIFYNIYGCLEKVFKLKEGNIYRYCWRHSLKKVGWTRCFVSFAIFRRFTSVFIFIVWWFVVSFVVIPRLIRCLDASWKI